MTEKDNFPERIEFVINRLNGPSEFARQTGVTLSTITRWRKGEAEPSRTNLVKVADKANVKIEWLAAGRGEIEWTTQDEKPYKIAEPMAQYSHSAIDNDFEFIDDCRDVIVTAGYGGINGDYPEIKKTKVESEWLRARGLKAEDCGKYKVCGDSMDDTLKDGEDIIVNHASKTLIDGKIFVLNNQGSMLIKRIQRTFSGVELLSDNSAYRPIKLTAEEADSLLVIGQVVLGYRNF